MERGMLAAVTLRKSTVRLFPSLVFGRGTLQVRWRYCCLPLSSKLISVFWITILLQHISWSPKEILLLLAIQLLRDRCKDACWVMKVICKEVNTIYNRSQPGCTLLRLTYIKGLIVLQRSLHRSILHRNTTVAEEKKILWCTGTLRCRQAAVGGKALNAWKNMELSLFQWSRKNSREKCQQQIAAGFYCRRRHGLWFPHVSFLSHYASSFHPIKHKRRLESTTQEAT